MASKHRHHLRPSLFISMPNNIFPNKEPRPYSEPIHDSCSTVIKNGGDFSGDCRYSSAGDSHPIPMPCEVFRKITLSKQKFNFKIMQNTQ